MTADVSTLRVLFVTLAGWVNRHHQVDQVSGGGAAFSGTLGPRPPRGVPVGNLIGPTLSMLGRAVRSVGSGPASWPPAITIVAHDLRRDARLPDCPPLVAPGARRCERSPGSRPGSGGALGEVMNPGDLGDRHHAPEGWGVHLPWPGRILLEGLVRTDGVVVDTVGTQRPAQMGRAENHEVIQALATDGADHSLHERLLPRR